ARSVEPTLGRSDVLARDQKIDAERPPAGSLADPGEIELELLGGVPDCTQHAEAAGAAHRGNDVTTMCERKDRKIDSEHLGNACAHGWISYHVVLFCLQPDDLVRGDTFVLGLTVLFMVVGDRPGSGRWLGWLPI